MRRRVLSAVALAAACGALIAAACGEEEAAPPVSVDPGPPELGDAGLPALASGLPATLELGMANFDGEVASMVATAPFGYRYQYLAGPADGGWVTWSHAWLRDGRAFVPEYIFESEEQGLIPVFSYYVLLQSTEAEGDEGERLEAGLADGGTMVEYFTALRTFFEQAGESDGTVVLHVEPDLWGFMQSRSDDGDPASIRVAMDAVHFSGLDELPDTLAGFAQGIVRLRDQLAPNVLLGYHVSTWSSGDDFIYDDPGDEEVTARAVSAASFYRRLGAPFDLVFAEFSDRDAAFKEYEYGDGGNSWFGDEDFARHLLWLGTVVRETGLRAMLWQIPYGNTEMRSLDNTPGHYQDNRVEWLLGDRGDGHLQAYLDAGVVALLFGRGADGATDASDAAGDGVTNPPPINGNEVSATSPDDDGGLFRILAALYYQQGPLPLP